VQEIVGSAFASIADEMATTIFRTAHSTVVRDVMDFSAALCDPSGETVAQAVTIPLHLGSIPTAMRALLERFGGDLHPGDLFVMNDPFDGGMHTPDIYVVKPVFQGVAHVGFAVTVAHHGDVGGRLPGTSACDTTEVFQEGLRLPWIRLCRDGEPIDDVVRVIRANVRIPRMTMGDVNAQLAACTIADRALNEFAGRYGPERLVGLMTRLVDHTERVVRAEIAGWPDGKATFVDYLDSDGIDVADARIEVELEIRGDGVLVDLSRSAPMVRGALNSTRSFTEATVYQAVMSAVSSDIPTSSGAFRPVEVVTKPGTVAHVVMPAASTMRGVTGFRMFDAVNGALAQLIPHRVPAAGEGGNSLAIFAGKDGAGEPFIYFELVVGTWGATKRSVLPALATSTASCSRTTARSTTLRPRRCGDRALPRPRPERTRARRPGPEAPCPVPGTVTEVRQKCDKPSTAREKFLQMNTFPVVGAGARHRPGPKRTARG
jgi:N-methylhydantoinase B